MLQHLAVEYAEAMVQQGKVGSSDDHQDNYELFLTEAIGTDTNENFKLIKIERKPLLNISDEEIKEMQNYAEKKNITFIEFYNMLDEQAKQRKQTFIEFYNMLMTEAKCRNMKFAEFYRVLQGLDKNKSVGENFDDLMQQIVDGLKGACENYLSSFSQYHDLPQKKDIDLDQDIESYGESIGAVGGESSKQSQANDLRAKKEKLQKLQYYLNIEKKSNFEKVQLFRASFNKSQGVFAINHDSACKRFILSTINLLTGNKFNNLMQKYGYKRFMFFREESKLMKKCEAAKVLPKNIISRQRVSCVA